MALVAKRPEASSSQRDPPTVTRRHQNSVCHLVLLLATDPAFKEPLAKFHFGSRAIVSAAARLIHQRLASVLLE